MELFHKAPITIQTSSRGRWRKKQALIASIGYKDNREENWYADIHMYNVMRVKAYA